MRINPPSRISNIIIVLIYNKYYNDKLNKYTSIISFGSQTGGTGWYRIARITNARHFNVPFRCRFNFSHGYNYNESQLVTGTISSGYNYKGAEIKIDNLTGGGGFVGFRLVYKVVDGTVALYIDGFINCLNYNVAGRDTYYLTFILDPSWPIQNSALYYNNTFYSKTDDLGENETLVTKNMFVDNITIGSTNVFNLERGVTTHPSGAGISANTYKSLAFYSQEQLRLLFGFSKPNVHFSGIIIYRKGIYSLIIEGTNQSNTDGVYKILNFKCELLSSLNSTEIINSTLVQSDYYLQLDILCTYSHTILFGSFSESDIMRNIKIFTGTPT